MKELTSFCVFVCVYNVEKGHALARSRVVEIPDVKAPNEHAACNIAATTAVADTEADPRMGQFVIGKVWAERPSNVGRGPVVR